LQRDKATGLSGEAQPSPDAMDVSTVSQAIFDNLIVSPIAN
jgi:hypothetical protein